MHTAMSTGCGKTTDNSGDHQRINSEIRRAEGLQSGADSSYQKADYIYDKAKLSVLPERARKVF